MRSNHTNFSIPSVLAIIAAFLSFYFGPILGLIFAAMALIFGVLGIFLALGSRLGGGGLSGLAVVLSVFGVITAIMKAIIWIVSFL